MEIQPMKLSVLDQSPVIHGHTAADAIAATIDLAQMADELGYTRYWCAEHHGMFGLANPCPEVLLARLGSVTRNIRLGSGGVMLPYYSAFKVLEQFMMLEAMFPGRIDLGIGRAPGGDGRTARVVAHGRYDPDSFPAQVADLIALASGHLPERHPAHGVLLQPAVQTCPQLWMLGSSDFGGALAAQLGMRFAFAHFISARGGDEIARGYRAQFRSGHHDAPYCAVALFVICAETEAQADALAAAVDLRRVLMAYGLNEPIPTIEQAQSWQPDEHARAVIAHERPRSIIGTPERVAERVQHLKAQFEADEVIVLTVAASYRARQRSYELLAEVFEPSNAALA